MRCKCCRQASSEIFSPKPQIFFSFLFFFTCFWYGQFLKSLLTLLQHCSCFMFWFFGPKACGILAPQPGSEPTLPALKVESLNTGPVGKSFFCIKYCYCSLLLFFWLPGLSVFILEDKSYTTKCRKIRCCFSSYLEVTVVSISYINILIYMNVFLGMN